MPKQKIEDRYTRIGLNDLELHVEAIIKSKNWHGPKEPWEEALIKLKEFRGILLEAGE